MNRELLQQVREALGMLIVDTQGHVSIGPHGVQLQLKAMAAVQAELAKPEPKPFCFLIDESAQLLRAGKTAIAHPTQSGIASYSLPLYRKEGV